jgi:hypothetical protein
MQCVVVCMHVNMRVRVSPGGAAVCARKSVKCRKKRSVYFEYGRARGVSTSFDRRITFGCASSGGKRDEKVLTNVSEKLLEKKGAG